MSNPTRETLISTGVHLGAIRRIGSDSYSPEEYLAAVQAARDAEDGERYADACLGVDVDSVLRGVEQVDDDVARIEASLRRRGIVPASATYEEYAATVREAGA
jgi:hypothetical protein